MVYLLNKNAELVEINYDNYNNEEENLGKISCFFNKNNYVIYKPSEQVLKFKEEIERNIMKIISYLVKNSIEFSLFYDDLETNIKLNIKKSYEVVQVDFIEFLDKIDIRKWFIGKVKMKK